MQEALKINIQGARLSENHSPSGTLPPALPLRQAPMCTHTFWKQGFRPAGHPAHTPTTSCLPWGPPLQLSVDHTCAAFSSQLVPVLTTLSPAPASPLP